MVTQHEMTIKSLENKLHEENLVHQSIIKHHIDEDQVRTPSFFLSLSLSLSTIFFHAVAGEKYKD